MQGKPFVRRQACCAVADAEERLLGLVDALDVDVAEEVVGVVAHRVVDEPKKDEGHHRHDELGENDDPALNLILLHSSFFILHSSSVHLSTHMHDAYDGCSVSQDGDEDHRCGSEPEGIEGCAAAEESAKRQTETGDDNALGALHQPNFALLAKAFRTGADVADHDAPDEGEEGPEREIEVSRLHKIIGESREGGELTVAIEHRVVEGAELALEMTGTSHVAVHHVHDREADDGQSRPPQQRERGGLGSTHNQVGGQQVAQET